MLEEDKKLDTCILKWLTKFPFWLYLQIKQIMEETNIMGEDNQTVLDNVQNCASAPSPQKKFQKP